MFISFNSRFNINKNFANKNINNNSDNKDSNYNKDEIIVVDEEYQCFMSSIDNEDLKYTLEKYYHFIVADNKIIDGQLENKYIFKDIESYNNFIYDSKVITITPHNNKDDEKTLSKSYYYFLIINGTRNDFNLYLSELDEKGYVCEKLSTS